MEILPTRPGACFTQFVILASILFETAAPPRVVGQDVQKESKMAQSQDPTPQRVAEMVAATSEPFYLGPDPKEITLDIQAPTGPAALHEGQSEDEGGREIYLYIENFSCTKPAPPFRVYLNVPPGDIPENHPELRVGNLGTFGLMKKSDPKGPHGGNGMTFKVDITDAVPGLIANHNWDPRRLRVSFTPGFWEGVVPPVKVGRVSLYFK